MISTEQFSWNKETKTLSAEASDIGLVAFPVVPSNEVVLRLRSHWTGREIGFKLVEVNRSTEGELMDIVLHPIEDRNPRVAGVRVVIFND